MKDEQELSRLLGTFAGPTLCRRTSERVRFSMNETCGRTQRAEWRMTQTSAVT